MKERTSITAIIPLTVVSNLLRQTVLFGTLLISLSSALLSSQLVLAATPPQIRFAMEATYPPFAFFNNDNQINGFEVDVANALCAVLDHQCTFSHQAFESLILNLKFHRSDAIISAMDITPARAQQVAFTQPYYHNTAIFTVLKGTSQQLETSQRQLRVGVQRGSTHQVYVLEQHKNMQVVAYDSYQNALIDLQNGRIQAIFADGAVVNLWQKQNQQLVTLGQPIADPRYFGHGIAIAVRHQDSTLLEALNHALNTLKKEGTLHAIKQRWFP